MPSQTPARHTPATPRASRRRARRITGAVGALALVVGLGWPLAFGAPKEGDDIAQRAVARGRELWTTPFGEGAKACSACHSSGANKLTAARLNAYPKYDRPLRAFVTGQQKINQMIRTKGGGTELPLGSDDLNALEAYIKSIGR